VRTQQSHEVPGRGRMHFSLYSTPQALARDAEARGSGHKDASPQFYGPDTFAQVVQKTLTGDEARVGASEEFMAALESAVVPTARPRWEDAPAGFVPNVPAFLAGHPASMRRRVRRQHESAPLALIADLAASATINATDVAKRGAAILALVRILGTRRPLELHAGSAVMHARGGACAVLARLDTTPLDVATAAHVLANPGWVRRLCYSLGERDYGFNGAWGFRDRRFCIAKAEELLAMAFPYSQVLVIPAIGWDDESVKDPAKWVLRYVERYEEEEAA